MRLQKRAGQGKQTTRKADCFRPGIALDSPNERPCQRAFQPLKQPDISSTARLTTCAPNSSIFRIVRRPSPWLPPDWSRALQRTRRSLRNYAIISCTMATEQVKTLSFRTPLSKVKQVDSVAASQKRDRTFIINEAIDQYLETRAYQISLIKEGIRQADAGEVVSHDQVRQDLNTHRLARKTKAR